LDDGSAGESGLNGQGRKPEPIVTVEALGPDPHLEADTAALIGRHISRLTGYAVGIINNPNAPKQPKKGN
jgi:hypothetical protein